jgi:mono/diheme cytochrome c family protein
LRLAVQELQIGGTGMRVLPTLGLGLALMGASAAAQDAQFAETQIKQGAGLFARHCATCHGTRMRNPQWGIDLRTFPRDAHARFVDTVANGKRQMPPWDDVLNAEEIEALWAYVAAGEPPN